VTGGIDGAAAGAGAGGEDEAGVGGSACAGLRVRVSCGVIMAFSTSLEPQTGQLTSPRLFCLSKAAELWNQLSKACPFAHLSA
jgi:hypothetical protein